MAKKQGSTGSRRGKLDIDQALLDPSSVFARPDEVVRHGGLSREQKIEILRRWEYDESEMSVAEEEGMPGGRPPMLDEVLQALKALGAAIDSVHTPPTKHGGI